MAWVNLSASQPVARYGAACCSGDGKIYVIGGYGSTGWSNPLNRMDIFDTATGIWSSETAPGETNCTECTAVYTSTAIYLFGRNLASNRKYTFSTGQWTTIANQTTRCQNLSSACDPDHGTSGTIYLMGGYTIAFQNLVYAYDIATNTFSTKTSLPAIRGWGQAFYFQNYVYYAGGENSSNPQATLYRALVTDATWVWATRTALPVARSEACGAWNPNDNKFYLAAGIDTNGAIQTVHIYDPAANSWNTTTVTNTNSPRVYGSAAIENNALYLLSGATYWDAATLVITDESWTFSILPNVNVPAVPAVASAVAVVPLPLIGAVTVAPVAQAFSQAIVPGIAGGQTLASVTVEAAAITVATVLRPPSLVVYVTINAAKGITTARIFPPCNVEQVKPGWKIRECGQGENWEHFDVGPSTFVRNKQVDVTNEQLLDGSLSRIVPPNKYTFVKEEYQIVWECVDQQHLNTLMKYLNKKVDILNHLREASTVYVDAIDRQYLPSGTSDQRYAVRIKVREA